MSFEEKSEDDKKILYCVIDAAGIRTEFRPRWSELLNGVNQMVFTEYKNAKKSEKDNVLDILESLRKITSRAERYCKELGYDV